MLGTRLAEDTTLASEGTLLSTPPRAWVMLCWVWSSQRPVKSRSQGLDPGTTPGLFRHLSKADWIPKTTSGPQSYSPRQRCYCPRHEVVVSRPCWY